MSDYAGTILQVAGAVVSYWFPPVGMAMMAAGGALNAYNASQQVIPGPKIGDVQKQIATEGGPIAIVFGYSPPMMGTVVADSVPLIIPEQEGGKGGPKQGKGETAFRTYAIMFCEGETTLRQAWKNGRFVYNADDPGMAADNAAFLEYATWLPGTYDQMPHAALEAIYGVGNAPAFRGRSVLVLDREDVTDMRGQRNQWHVRVFRGAAKSVTSTPYAAKFASATSHHFAATDGLMVNRLADGQTGPDQTDVSFGITGGTLYEAPYGDQTDEVNVSFGITGGTLAPPPYGELADDVDSTFGITGGELKPAPIGGTKDESEVSFGITGGSLYVP